MIPPTTGLQLPHVLGSPVAAFHAVRERMQPDEARMGEPYSHQTRPRQHLDATPMTSGLCMGISARAHVLG